MAYKKFSDQWLTAPSGATTTTDCVRQKAREDASGEPFGAAKVAKVAKVETLPEQTFAGFATFAGVRAPISGSSEAPCAQCGLAEPGPINLVTAVNYQVRLHPGMCERLWLAGHPPAVTALSSVVFNGVPQ
jgi:hypothetical protein